MTIPTIIYKTNSSVLKKNYSAWFRAVATILGLLVLSNAIFDNHSIGDILAFPAGIAVYFWYVGITEFKLDEKGIYKEVKPWLPNLFNVQIFNKHFEFSEIRSYKTGSYHASRIITFPLRLTKFFEINFVNGECWKITDEGYNDEFIKFQDAFIKVIEDRNSSIRNYDVITRNKTLFEIIWVRVCLGIFYILSFATIIFFIIFPKYANWDLIVNIELLVITIVISVWIYYKNT